MSWFETPAFCRLFQFEIPKFLEQRDQKANESSEALITSSRALISKSFFLR